MNLAVKHLSSCKCVLGEGPLWLPEKETLVFLDIIGKALLYWNDDIGLRKIPLSQKVGSIAAITEDLFLASSERGLYELEGLTGALKSIGHDHVITDDALMNDGKCDRKGAFIFGSKAVNESDAIGSLMSIKGEISTHWQGGIVLNGPAFSPDGKRIYFADSPSKKIYTASYDADSRMLGEIELFTKLAVDAGYPDGMTVDSEGCLWNAHWDGWRISRYKPNGKLIQEIEMPVSRPTSMAFGGEDMKTLYVTSAQKGLEANPAATEAYAGDLFSIDLDVAGIVETNFIGINRNK